MVEKFSAKQEKLEDIGAEEKPVCFVIMPFSNPPGYDEGHFRKVYEQIFVPSIEAAGYRPHRVDDDSSSTVIQAKILVGLVNAPVVLCDLSSRNPNVLYELGIRHAFDLPVVLVKDERTDKIFDIGNISTIPYHESRRYEEVLEDRKNITNALLQTVKSKQTYSVMSIVRLTSATIPTGTDMTQDDKISLWLASINESLSRLQKQVETLQKNEKLSLIVNQGVAIPTPNEIEKLYQEKLLQESITKAKVLLSGKLEEKVDDIVLNNMYKNLTECYIAAADAGVDEKLLQESKTVRLRISTLADKMRTSNK